MRAYCYTFKLAYFTLSNLEINVDRPKELNVIYIRIFYKEQKRYMTALH